MTNIGHKQKQAISIGKEKGYIDTNDLTDIWENAGTRKVRMGTLIFLGYFSNPELKGVIVKWNYKGPK